MMLYNINSKLNYRVHEFEFRRLNKATIHRFADMLMNIIGMNDGNYKYILMDAREVEMIPLTLLASEIRNTVTRCVGIKCYIALVVEGRIATHTSADILKTMLERGDVELFTSIEKSYLWLEYLM